MKNEEKKQRVSYKDALEILDKEIKNFKDPIESATEYVRDYNEGSQLFINKTVVYNLIKKITRP